MEKFIIEMNDIHANRLQANDWNPGVLKEALAGMTTELGKPTIAIDYLEVKFRDILKYIKIGLPLTRLDTMCLYHNGKIITTRRNVLHHEHIEQQALGIAKALNLQYKNINCELGHSGWSDENGKVVLAILWGEYEYVKDDRMHIHIKLDETQQVFVATQSYPNTERPDDVDAVEAEMINLTFLQCEPNLAKTWFNRWI